MNAHIVKLRLRVLSKRRMSQKHVRTQPSTFVYKALANTNAANRHRVNLQSRDEPAHTPELVGANLRPAAPAIVEAIVEQPSSLLLSLRDLAPGPGASKCRKPLI